MVKCKDCEYVVTKINGHTLYGNLIKCGHPSSLKDMEVNNFWTINGPAKYVIYKSRCSIKNANYDCPDFVEKRFSFKNLISNLSKSQNILEALRIIKQTI